MLTSLEMLPMILPGLVVGLVFHELAHAWTADRLGDPTPRRDGRLTLNPLAHLDPMGSLVLLVTGRFGWARPVVVNPYNFRDPRRGMLLVAAAGPATNLVLAFLLKLAVGSGALPVTPAGYAGGALYYAYVINLSLAVFNLLPIPPLDGSRILAGLLPAGMARVVDGLERYGLFIMVILLLTGVIGNILLPMLGALDQALTAVIVTILKVLGTA